MNIVRARRKELGLTLRDVRARTGVAISYLSSIERESRAVSLNHARAIARVLDSTVDELFPEEPPAPTAGATGGDA